MNIFETASYLLTVLNIDNGFFIVRLAEANSIKSTSVIDGERKREREKYNAR